MIQRPRTLISTTIVAIATLALAPMGFAKDDDDDRNYSNKHSRGSSAFSVALIGDGPYGDDKEAGFDYLIKDINKDKDVELVLHVGDIKSGGTECSDERIDRRFKQLQKIRTALLYTPGDNEWTDCHRASNGSYDPLERLTYVRNRFFPYPNWSTGKRPVRVYTQANQSGYEQFVENTLRKHRGVFFAQVHVVGSNNNLRPWNGIDSTDSTDNPRPDRIEEYTLRNAANLAWLDRTFALAKKSRAKGVVVSVQADMNLETDVGSPSRNGFDDFIARLYSHTASFKKPVVLAHGDSHLFRVDTPRLRPFYHSNTSEVGLVIPNLTRVESFGDSELHWVEIKVDPRSKEVFSFNPRVVDANR